MINNGNLIERLRSMLCLRRFTMAHVRRTCQHLLNTTIGTFKHTTGELRIVQGADMAWLHKAVGARSREREGVAYSHNTSDARPGRSALCLPPTSHCLPSSLSLPYALRLSSLCLQTRTVPRYQHQA